MKADAHMRADRPGVAANVRTRHQRALRVARRTPDDEDNGDRGRRGIFKPRRVATNQEDCLSRRQLPFNRL